MLRENKCGEMVSETLKKLLGFGGGDLIKNENCHFDKKIAWVRFEVGHNLGLKEGKSTPTVVVGQGVSGGNNCRSNS